MGIAKRLCRIAGVMVMSFGVFLASAFAQEKQVMVYSHRHYEADQKLYDRFTAKTGIKVTVLKGDADQLIQRIKAEGSASRADILMTADIGRLWYAQSLGLLQAVSSKALDAIPAQLREPRGYWFGLTKRARVMVYDTSRFSQPPLVNYEDVARPEFAGKVLVRSSGNVYNISLIAGLMERWGEKKTGEWIKGLSANLARTPKGGDRDQIKAMVAGEGTVAITNTYYIIQMLQSQDAAERELAKRIGVIFPDQQGKGTHINISGAGICVSSPNRTQAILLLEFLASREAQEVFAAENGEYPVIRGVELSPILASWGIFKEDALSLDRLGVNSARALELADANGWK